MNKTLFTFLMILFGLTTTAQNLSVKGTVTSEEDGEPLIGATVRVKGAPTGVTTDIDGQYTINVSKGAILQFSYVGYEPQEKTVSAAGTVDVALSQQSNMLDELVVIGYGSVKKSDLTGSVSSVSSDKLTKTPAASLSNALQGQVAGVTVNSLTGRPGAEAEVRIRGVGTTHNAAPIYVVDGVISDDINFLSPNDIEHIEVLKDASATAIYGSRGANGVIIVSTRTGGLGQPTRVTFNGYVGVQQRWKKLDVMGAKDFADTWIGINGNARQKTTYAEKGLNGWLSTFKTSSSPYYPTVYDPEKYPTGVDYTQFDTDWQDEVFRNGMIQNYHLAIDGGSEKLAYNMSASWFQQDGIIIGSDYSRFTARLNTSFQAFPWMRIGENISFMASTAKNAFESGDNVESAGANILSAAFAMAPWDPARYPDGSVNRAGKDMSGLISASTNNKETRNPLSMVEYFHPHTRNERFVGNAFIELTPVKHFNFRSSYSFDYRITTNKSFQDAYEVSAYDKEIQNFLSSSMARNYYWNVDNILTYNRDFGKHSLTAMAGFTIEEYNYYSLGNSGAGILNPEERNWYLSQVTTDYGVPNDAVSRNRRQSWLGRVNYSYDSRYLLTVNFRADGSSKFVDKKWGYFPSFALAWRLSRESFMKDFENLTDLKIRFGWGKVGNDNIGNDAFLQKMASGSEIFNGYVFGIPQTVVGGASVLTWVNNGGHWENTEQWSAGVDFTLWNGKLSGSVDGFIRDTNDMLMNVNAPAHVGNRYMAMANVGKVRNKGIEISLDHRNTLNSWFRYSVGGNISFIDNKLVALNGGSTIYTNYKNLQVVDEGFPLYYFWGFKYDGIYRTDQEVLDYLTGYDSKTSPYHAGDAKFVDINGDGIIDDNDRTNLGSAIPKINYGINLGFWLKDFDIQLFFQGVAGSKIYNAKRMQLEGYKNVSVYSPIVADAWTTDNPDGVIPNIKNAINYDNVSDRFLESGNYFRLKNLQIGYSLPKSILGNKGIKSCRFYAQCSNLFTITNYSGFDPEVSSGVDWGNYPQSRTFIFGVNLTY